MEAKLGQAYATHYWGAIINNNFKFKLLNYKKKLKNLVLIKRLLLDWKITK